MKELYSIDTGYACFGIVAENSVVVEAAPIARWTTGKSLQYVLDWYKTRKGATFEKMSTKIRVVNKKSFKGQGEYVGRPSPLGNPFSHESGTQAEFIVATREEAVEKYREWLRQKWVENGAVRRELERLALIYNTVGHLTLVCWCKPESCHADVIKDAVEKIGALM